MKENAKITATPGARPQPEQTSPKEAKRPAQRPEDRARGDVGTGVSVIIRRGSKVLCGKRKGSHRAGFWCFPGGHLDFSNEWTSAAAREVKEETGLTITNVRPVAVSNNIMAEDGVQYTTIYLEADCPEGEAKVLESDKCERWIWTEQVPAPHMTPRADLERMGVTMEDGPEVPPSLNFALLQPALE